MQGLKGSCSCGAVKYQVAGDVKSIVNCHCNLCRKMNGSAFSTYVAVADDDFELQSGDLKSHQVTEHAQKNFCATCGTPVFNTNPKYAGLTILHFGSLDDSPDVEPAVNIYCDSELGWLEQLPDMSRRPQGF